MTGSHSDAEEPKDRRTDSERPKERRINPIAIVAGALASISAAVVASYFGVAGTLIGAAVVSVVSSIGAALYAGVIGATASRVQRTDVVHRVSTTVRQPPWMTGTGTEVHGPGAGDATGGSRGPHQAPPEGEAPGGIPVPGRAAPGGDGGTGGTGWGTGGGAVGGPGGGTGGGRPDGPPGPHGPNRRRRWLVIAGVALVIFAIAIGALTGIEAAIREPLASAVGVRHRGDASTSIGVAVHRASGARTTSTVPPTSTTGPGTTATTQPGQSTTTRQPGPTTTGPSSTTPPTTQEQPAQPGQRSTPTTNGGGMAPGSGGR
jgi:hypothetical protein